MIILFLLVSFLVTLMVVPIFRYIAKKLNIVDKPNYRKIQDTPKPYLGGLSIFISCALTLQLYQHDKISYTNKILIFGAFAIMLLGLIDDKYDINSFIKLFFQLVISFIAAFGMESIDKVEIFHQTIYFSDIESIILVAIWIVIFINAFNLIDGLDGLSTGVAIISFTTLLIVVVLGHDYSLIVLLLIIIGSLIGFLFYNFYPATIFLGDSGSMLIGYTIAILTITNYKTVTITSLFLIILVGFIPILDAILAFVRRRKNGENAFKSDAFHFHHRLILHGYSHANAVLLMYLFMCLYSIGAILITYFKLFKYKLIVLIFIIILTIYIIEKYYLLSNKYSYFANGFRKVFK